MAHFFKNTVASGLAIGLAMVGVTSAQLLVRSPAATAQSSGVTQILAAHNSYRKQVNVPPLKWSNTLANHAQQWANNLARRGGRELAHSDSASRPGEGENLWMGTAGRFTYSQMVGSWGDEKKNFVRGTFPNVSSTGNWADVGHYTQIVWKNTKSVGCATARAGGNDIFVCRYSPPGNYMGQRVY